MRGKRSEGPEGSIRSFGLHILDNLFRHRVLFALPLLIFTALGVTQVRNDIPVYESTAVVRIGSNPNIGRPLVRGANFGFRETRAEGTIRVIEEQFSTRQFATNVTKRAGLGDSIGAGWGVLEFVRTRVELDTEGDALMSVTATWENPATSLALVEATIATYSTHLAETAINDAAQAEQFYLVVLEERQDAVTNREDELAEYLRSLPPVPFGIERNIAESVEIERRERQFELALADLAEAQRRVDAAVVANTIAQNSTAVVVVDAAQRANRPVSTRGRNLQTAVAYLVMGGVISGIALLVTSALDPSFTAPSDVASMPGVGAVALAPPLKPTYPELRRSDERDRGDVDPDSDGTRTLVSAGRADSRTSVNEDRSSQLPQGRP